MYEQGMKAVGLSGSIAGYANAIPQTSSESEVAREMRRLGSTLSELSGTFDVLAERLQAVTSPRPAEREGATTPRPVCSSKMGSEISGMADHAQNVLQRVAVLVSSLAI